ncbi:thiocillin family RiPP [Actinomyces qiguomingii]|uniref:thiocillin family RiPP n=1 Tax=Actinomyces qiguomingii TaxID=2057800 RepID=UPI000CA05BBD|nr:thiocillin family RiPP [Actinomyces qiguomingii]
MNSGIIDLLAQEIDQDVESLPEGNALGTTSSLGSASTSACPATSASTVSSWGCLG